MLVLTRRLGEEIVIRVPGRLQPIVVRIAEFRNGGKVRIGIAADHDVSVHRAEVDKEIQR